MARVDEQYARGDLLARILGALEAAGHPTDPLDPAALALAEEFHTLGALATTQLAEAVGITAEDRVIELGSGIGGPARHLARTHGCRVEGVDLTEEFCAVAQDLNRRTGLDDRVQIRVGDVTDLPFGDSSFDVAWTQHVAMNVEDKAAMYREARRVLRPGGRLALFDIMAGPGQPLTFPVPWADGPEVSFLRTPEDTRGLIEEAGFRIERWIDLTADALVFFDAMAAADGPSSPAIGLGLVIPDFVTKVANLAANVRADRARVVRAVATAA